MVANLGRNWWLLALRGLAGILFGIGAFVWPGGTLAVLVILFGAYALVDGIFALIAGIRLRSQMDFWWLMILEGVVGIIVGVLTFMSPGITALVLVTFIAAWSIITGVFEIATAIRMRKVIDNEWMLILAGLGSLLFGVLLFLFPGAGALSLVWLIGAYALIFGILTLVLAFRVRGMQDEVSQPSAAA